MSMRDPVFYQIMQSALTRAYPSGLPSNQVITQFASPYDTVTLPDSILATLYEIGYPYGWGEDAGVHGAGTYSLTEPLCNAWILRLNAQIPSGDSVGLSASIGGGAQKTLQQADPAQLSIYADDLFQWSNASALGRVGISPWNTPTGWTDAEAEWIGPQADSETSAPIGQWLLKKWVFIDADGIYNFALCGDGAANLYMDGTAIITGTTSSSASTASTQITAGWHLFTVSCLNTGSTPNATGVLFSFTDSSGDVVENGSYSPAVGVTWQTSGYINPTWTAVNSESDLRYVWYVIPASEITSQSVSLEVSATGSPTIHGLWWYSVAPWRWTEGGEWNATAASGTRASNPPTKSAQFVG